MRTGTLDDMDTVESFLQRYADFCQGQKGVAAMIVALSAPFDAADDYQGDLAVFHAEDTANEEVDFEKFKYDVMTGAGRELAKRHLSPLAVGYLSEAWMANKEDIPEGCMPRHAAAKEEVLTIVTMSCYTNECHAHHCVVTRDAEDHMSFGEWETSKVNIKDAPLLLSFYKGYVAEHGGTPVIPAGGVFDGPEIDPTLSGPAKPRF